MLHVFAVFKDSGLCSGLKAFLYLICLKKKYQQKRETRNYFQLS